MLSFKANKLYFLVVLFFISSTSAYSQYKILGYSSVLPAIYYGPYTISGGTLSTSDHWTVTGGTINNTSNTTINNDGTPSIGVTWNSGTTSGTVAYYLSGSSNPVVTYTVCISNNYINSGNEEFYPDYFPFVPSGLLFTVNLTATDATPCTPINYVWQTSTDGINYTAIANSNTQNYVANQVFTQNTYFRRVVFLPPYSYNSNAIMVNVVPPVQPGAISPGSMTIKQGTSPGVFTVAPATGGSMCGGNYTYTWQTSNDNLNWSNVGTGLSYNPGTVLAKTFLRVLAYCGPVAGVSNTAPIRFYQLDPGLISPISISVAPNTNPGVLTGNPASDGNSGSTFTYQWEYSTDGGSSFLNASGSSGSINYTPSYPSVSIFYRRRVTSNSGQIGYSNTVNIQIGLVNSANYVKSRTITASNITSSSAADALTSLNDVKQTTSYFDGLGRLAETVAMKNSLVTTGSTVPPTDLVICNQYDPVGNEPFKYLSYVSTAADGLFKPNALPEQNLFNNAQYSGEIYNYGQVNFESSPFHRQNSESAPGISWTGSNRNVQNLSTSNTTNDIVRIWYVSSSAIGSFGSYNSPAIYPNGSLNKRITIDEKGKQSIEYIDKTGHTILKKVQLTAIADDGTGSGYTGWLCTYYIYDDLGNLRCVVQPHGVELLIQNSWDITALSNSILNEQCFRYEYDQRNRMIIKKVPGADAVYMVYDNLDRLVMTQDGNLRTAPNKWMVTLYENTLNRPVETGLYSTSSSFISLLAAAANNFSGYPFTTSGAPAYPTFEILTKTHYDDYTGLPTGLTATLSTSALNMSNFYTGSACNISPTYVLPLSQNSLNTTKGLATWTQTEVLGSGGGQYISSANIFDDWGRMIQQQTINYSNGLDILTTQYDFSGKPRMNDIRHQKVSSGSPTQTYEIATRNNYDDLGRPSKTEKMIITSVIPTPAWKTISTSGFDNLGRFVKKTIGNDPANIGGGYVPLESQAYDYNIRGWLLGANRPYINTSSLTNYFGFELGYDKANTIVAGKTYTTQQYNGNISGTIWKNASDVATRKYDFTYDAVDRLTAANYSTLSAADQLDFNVSIPQYDANGNIVKMNQNGWNPGGANSSIDVLTYNPILNTNRLQNVVDDKSLATTTLGDFRYSPIYTTTLPSGIKPATATDYSYDVNGNLTSDKNKDITSITYNYLNLPAVIAVANKGTITYTYDAGGNKLAKQTYENGTGTTFNNIATTITTTTNYVTGFVYETKNYGASALSSFKYTDKLQFFGQEEGRARALYNNASSPNTLTGFAYDYMLKDHLGNTRMLVTEEAAAPNIYPDLNFEGTGVSDQNVINQNATWDAKISGQPIDVVGSRVLIPPAGFNSSQNGIYCSSITKAQGAIGASKLLKVMARDQLTVSINYTYNSIVDNSSANGLNTLLNSLANMILGSPDVSSTIHNQASSLASNQNNYDVQQFFNSQNTEVPGNNTTPKAYLHVLLFNDQFVFDNVNSIVAPITASGSNGEGTLGPLVITVPKSGYAYIYFSNESNTTVYFDNFRLTHQRGQILEATNYYPFGLTMAGISSQAAGNFENKYKYNGKELQHKEFSDGSGFEEYDYGARFYDPQIGRWHKIDNKASIYQNITPYAYAANQPINAIDPDGNLIIFINGMHSGDGGKPDYWRRTVADEILVGSTLQGINSFGIPSYQDEYVTTYRRENFDLDVMDKFDDHKKIANDLQYLDGSVGGKKELMYNMYEGFREEKGHEFGKAHVEEIINSLTHTGGVIIETLKIVTHSMGAAYGNGFVRAILEWVKANPEKAKGLNITVYDFAPFQENQITANKGVTTYQFDNRGDMVVGYGLVGGSFFSKEKGADERDIEGGGSHSIFTFLDRVSKLKPGNYVYKDGQFIQTE